MSKQTRTPDPLAGRSLYAQVQSLAKPDGAECQFGAAGILSPPAGDSQLAMFELTEPMRFPGEGDDEPDCPYSPNARMVWRLGDGAYGGLEFAAPHTLYHPTALRSGPAAVGLAPLAVGQRCYAWLNRQSGRWEAIAAPLLWRRFEMTAALTCGQQAAAVAYSYDADGERIDDAPPAETLIVYDSLECFSKMTTASGDRGALGLALFWPDRQRWEIAQMQTPGDFWGTLEGDLQVGDDSQTVRLAADGVATGYDVFGSNHGPTLVAHQPEGGGTRPFSGREGDAVYCRWDTRRARYQIVWVEPNDLEWQSLDVVTRTTLSINFGAQTFQHRHFTRQIRLPPWITIGAEVERL
jgi:hypothetical protein